MCLCNPEKRVNSKISKERQSREVTQDLHAGLLTMGGPAGWIDEQTIKDYCSLNGEAERGPKTKKFVSVAIPCAGAACHGADSLVLICARTLSVFHWQIQVKPRPLPRLAFAMQLAAMLLHNPMADCQPQSHALAQLFGCEERIKHLLLYFR